MSERTAFTVKDTTANPAPLGLMGFGMTTVLLNIHNAGFCELGSSILAMGIFYGGIAQIIAGIMEWKKNNTFGATAFTSYGLFWLSLVALIVMPELGWVEKASKGKAMSRAPFGYKLEKGHLIPAQNFREIEEIFEEFLEKGMTLNKLR